MRYRIAVCDDDPAEADYISGLAGIWGKNADTGAAVDVFHSAEEFLFRYEEDKGYDILLLDIEMGGMDGVSLARTVRAGNETVQIIFITGYPDYISEGYDVAALHYLMKPVTETKLCEVLNRAAKETGKRGRVLLFQSEGESLRLREDEIMYAEAFSHSTEITAVTGRFEISEPISGVEKRFGPEFVRCHRSYIVNLKFVVRITKTDVVLENGTAVPLSRRLYRDVNQAFINYYKAQE